MPDKQMNLPIMSNDPQDKMLQAIKRFDPNFKYFNLLQLADFPVASDYELLLHYFRGAAGPFIDLFLYCDLGVGWTFKAEGFSNEEEGLQAIELVEEEYFHRKKMDFRTTMNQFGAFGEVLGRNCLVDTYTLDGDFFIDKNFKVTGRDAINPMTLEEESVRRVMVDTTGTEMYKQQASMVDGKFITIPLEQDRVQFYTNNVMTKSSPLGNSKLQRCVTDLRTLGRFPHYRMKLGKKYSELFRIIEVNSEKIAEHGLGKKITDDVEEAQKYLDDTAEFYRQQEEKGSTAAVFDWEKVIETSFAGKEIKLDDVERSTINSLGFKLGVPIQLMMYAADLLNRNTLQGLLETFIASREKGIRQSLYKPIIDDTANKILEINGYTKGRLSSIFNPFLSKDLQVMADIVSKVFPTGSISKPEIRELFDWSKEINMGGKEWEDLEPMPSASASSGVPFSPVEDITKEMLQKGLIRQL